MDTKSNIRLWTVPVLACTRRCRVLVETKLFHSIEAASSRRLFFKSSTALMEAQPH